MAFFEFEQALHTEIRAKGYVPKERIAELLNEKSSAYLGQAVTLEEDDGYFFVPLSHIRRFFYVYSYAYGGLLSRLVSRRAVERPELFESVVELLSSGASTSPKNLFKSIGINTEKKKMFTDALGVVRADFEHLKNL
jgi:oligoendopeptidase F